MGRRKAEMLLGHDVRENPEAPRKLGSGGTAAVAGDAPDNHHIRQGGASGGRAADGTAALDDTPNLLLEESPVLTLNNVAQSRT
jgi:hypothetical protein